MQKIDYDKIANIYAQNRKAGSFVVEELLRGSKADSTSHILEVGCGNGNHIQRIVEAIGCQGWGVDPSLEMIHRAQINRQIQFVGAAAEELPLKDAYFDFIFSVDVIHHLKSTLTYFREALRALKLGGTICTVIDSERIIRNRSPLSKYWPGSAVVDLQRYPSISTLKDQMKDAGFSDIVKDIQAISEITDITPYREKAFSSLQLIAQDEFLEGLSRLQEDFNAGPVQRVSMYTCLWGRSP